MPSRHVIPRWGAPSLRTPSYPPSVGDVTATRPPQAMCRPRDVTSPAGSPPNRRPDWLPTPCRVTSSVRSQSARDVMVGGGPVRRVAGAATGVDCGRPAAAQGRCGVSRNGLLFIQRRPPALLASACSGREVLCHRPMRFLRIITRVSVLS